MSIKNMSRLRRAKKTRMNIEDQESPRLTVFRSSIFILVFFALLSLDMFLILIVMLQLLF
jgi:ribosomal protein L18